MQMFCFMHPSKSVFVLHFALTPLCIHGNRCPNGSAAGKVNNVKSVEYDHWKVQTSTSVSLLSKESQESSMIVFLVIL